jgi:hypothetical protein
MSPNVIVGASKVEMFPTMYEVPRVIVLPMALIKCSRLWVQFNVGVGVGLSTEKLAARKAVLS